MHIIRRLEKSNGVEISFVFVFVFIFVFFGKTYIISGWYWEEQWDADDTDGQAKVDAALVLQLGGHPGELERDVDGEDDQAEGGEEVVEGEEEGVEGAIGGRLLPVVVHVVLNKERGHEATI